MRITIEHEEVQVSIKTNDELFADVMDNLIIPALLGVGFSQETIDKYWSDE